MKKQVCGQLTLFPEDSPASRSQSLDREKEKQMTVTSGQKCSVWCRKSGPLGLLVKMLLASPLWRSRTVRLKWRAEKLPATREKTTTMRYSFNKKRCCSRTFFKTSKTPGMTSSRLLYRLVASMPRISVPGSVSLDIEPTLWKTPVASDAANRQYYANSRGEPNLSGMVKLWPTPTATVATHGGPHQRDSSGRPGLQMAATLWPTPRAKESGTYQYSQGRHDHPVLTLTGAARMYPTPTKFDATCGNLKGKEYTGQSHHAMKLIQAAKLYPTPMAQDANNSTLLREMWTTPCVADAEGTTGGNNHRSLRTDVGGQLNPDWVEWLMGYPIGWTNLSPSQE